MDIGQTFAPIGNPMQRPNGTAGTPAGLSGVQQAIKILNLRMPRVQGAAAIAPTLLLNSPGAGGLPQPGRDPILDAILRGVLGGYAPPQQTAPSAPGGATPVSVPPPKITPINPPQGNSPQFGVAPLPIPPSPNYPESPASREDRENRRGKTGTDYFPVLAQ